MLKEKKTLFILEMNTSGEYGWGKSAWVFIHCMLANYTPEKKDDYITFFRQLEHMLPCIYCRKSYGYFVKLLPIENYLDTKLHAVYWGYLLHDLVNKKLNKVSPSFIETIKHCERYRAR